MKYPWTETPRAILSYYNVDPDVGLTTDQAARHAEIYGKNGKS